MANHRINSVEELPARHRESAREQLARSKFARPATAAAKLPANVADIRRRDYKREYLDSLERAGLPAPELEQLFDPVRKWRFDFCWRNSNGLIVLAVEYEGISADIKKSGHQTRDGMFKNIEKYNAAALARICVIRITYNDVKSGKALEWTETALRDLLEIE